MHSVHVEACKVLKTLQEKKKVTGKCISLIVKMNHYDIGWHGMYPDNVPRYPKMYP